MTRLSGLTNVRPFRTSVTVVAGVGGRAENSSSERSGQLTLPASLDV